MADGNLLGEAGPKRVRARDDDAVIDAEFEKGIAASPYFGDEFVVRHRDFAVLVAALLFV